MQLVASEKVATSAPSVALTRRYLLISGTKYSPTLLLSITFLNIIFDWNEYHDQISKILEETSLRSLGYEISYHVICGAPLYIQFLLTATVGDEKNNVDILGAISI